MKKSCSKELKITLHFNIKKRFEKALANSQIIHYDCSMKWFTHIAYGEVQQHHHQQQCRSKEACRERRGGGGGKRES